MTIFAFSIPGGSEWFIILLIVLVIFGAGKLPQVFTAFGKGMKNFRDAQKEGDDPLEVNKEISEQTVVSSEEATVEADEVIRP